MPEVRNETIPVSSIPHRVPDAGNTATIGKAVRIVGQIFTKEDLNVDGDVEGTIESTDNKVANIGTTGRVQASVKAREVVIFGRVQGNVEADKVDIRREAKLVGDITTARISIEDGALFKGSIDIRKPEPKPAISATTGAATSAAAAPATPSYTSTPQQPEHR